MATISAVLSLLATPDNLPLLTQLNRGIEKEGLRTSDAGMISQAKHPEKLGSTLTHPYITTDYSEALLEFITPVFTSAHEALAHLDIAHRFTYQALENELIWPNSMPCLVQGEMSVPIADYGSSNSGQLKHIYRHGLWHRYGRIMQCIAGIHYNFSLPQALWEVLHAQDSNAQSLPLQDYISARYFGLIRNFRRHSWLLLYLFGASPAVCESFLAGREHQLKTLHKHTLYAPYATSLRMSDFGYQNNAQSSLKICYNRLDSYITTLGQAITVPVPAYEAIGLKDEQGRYKQLNANLLQIENEYYSDIRPKRISKQGAKPLQALAQEGVEYIEVRNTDINPFLPLGLDVPQMAFLDTFLMWCLLSPSPETTAEEYANIGYNHQQTTLQGRLPGLTLKQGNTDIRLQDWGFNIIEELSAVAELLDQAGNCSFHQDALHQQRLKLADSSLTPAAQLLTALQETGLEYVDFTLQQAKAHQKTLTEPLNAAVLQQWQDLATNSLTEQQLMEKNDTISFDEYLRNYAKK